MKKIFDKKILRTLLLSFLFIVTLAVSQGCVTSKETIKVPTIKRVAAGEMLVTRAFHNSVLLKDGRVIIFGGVGDSYQVHAEIYDPETKTNKAIKSKMIAENVSDLSGIKGFLLDDGKVLLVNKAFLQVFNPETEEFTKINIESPYELTKTNMKFANIPDIWLNIDNIIELGEDRFFMTDRRYSYIFNAKNNSFKITEIDLPHIIKNKNGKRPLPDGSSIVKVKNNNLIITGGVINSYPDNSRIRDEIIEFNIDKNTSKVIGKLLIPRISHKSFLLPDGNILTVGGRLPNESKNEPDFIPVEIYNTKLQESKVVGYISSKRFKFILIGDNLIAAGDHKIDIFNTKTNKLYSTNTELKRASGQSVTVLNNKTILMTGGISSRSYFANYLKNIDLFYLK